MNDKKVIKMEIPSKKEYSRILRLTAAGAADACGFDIDLIEDVKIIVSEVFGSILKAGCEGSIVSFEPAEGKLAVCFETCSGESVLKGANEMTLPILEALAESVVVGTDGGLKLVIE